MICLYFGTGECPNCGGVNGARFRAANGVRFCSQACAEETAEVVTAFAARREGEWCPECGFDRWEHSPDCPKQPAPGNSDTGMIGG